MRRELNKEFLERLVAPEAGRLEVFDTKRPGLSIRVSQTGRKSFTFEKRVKNGVKRKHNLGQWPHGITLADARKMANQIAAEADLGVDRILEAEKKRQAEAAEAARLVTVSKALEVYDSAHLSGIRTGRERRRQLDVALADHMALSVTSLTRAHLQAAIDAKASEGRRVMANRVRSALRGVHGMVAAS